MWWGGDGVAPPCPVGSQRCRLLRWNWVRWTRVGCSRLRGDGGEGGEVPACPVGSQWCRPPSPVPPPAVESGWSRRPSAVHRPYQQALVGVPRPAAGAPHRGADARPACTHSFWLSPAWLLGWKSLTIMPSCRMFSTNFSRCSSRWSNFSAMASSARSSACSSQRLKLGPALRFRLPDVHFRFLGGGQGLLGGGA